MAVLIMTEEAEWVRVTEAAEITGYHRDHVQELAREKKIEARITPTGYEVFMPSLWAYIRDKGRGPQKPTEEFEDSN